MTPSHEDHDRLSPDDRRLLDELVDAGFDERVHAGKTPEERARLDRLVGLLSLMNDYPVDDGDETLVNATLAAISRYEDERAARLSLADRAGQPGGPRRLRLPDFMTVAAVLLIAVGVLWPVTNQVRKRAADMGCANNLRYVGYAFGEYASDHDGAMPMAIAGVNWDPVGRFFINVNLTPLVAGDYCDYGHLHCPGAGGHELSSDYSYQCRTADIPLVWGADPSARVVLGDRNPLIDAFRDGREAYELTTSPNHGGRGQNVLGTDGATIWLDQPVIGRGDNIWLPDGERVMRAGLRPADSGDVFLVH